ncbi:transcriptional regulator [Ancylobacter sp. VNQ12]|uniref:transcriptional regulator n=1 Tax=Ancylobacter sp. VNQ12 TaxID=3400920 RepID=UPI003C034D1C
MAHAPGLVRAIEAIGSQEALGKALGVGQSLISYWLNHSRRGVPAERVLDVERVTGVSRHDLRPDLYPAPSPPPIASPTITAEAAP